MSLLKSHRDPNGLEIFKKWVKWLNLFVALNNKLFPKVSSEYTDQLNGDHRKVEYVPFEQSP